jgi:hypothetical protein
VVRARAGVGARAEGLWRETSPLPPGEGCTRVSVVPGLSLRRGFLAPRHAVCLIVSSLAILGQPGTGVLQETDQIQAHQKLGGAPTGTFPKPGGDLCERVGSLTAGPLGHQLCKGGTVSWNGRIEPGIIRRPHRDDGAHLGVWLAQNLSGTLVHMRDPLSLARTVGGPFHRTVMRCGPAL